MTKDEALKMAIEALEAWDGTIEYQYNGTKEAMSYLTYIAQQTPSIINACKEALEQPSNMVAVPLDKLQDMQRRLKAIEQTAQEPVAWMHRHAGEITEFNDFQSCEYCEPLYTYPHQWQGLTDDEIEYWECLKAPPVHPDFLEDDSWREFARCIEQALKEKNT